MKEAPQEVTIWSIQTKDAWELAQQRDMLKADGRRVWHDFRDPYRWLRDQMLVRTDNFDGEYPLWAWHSERPDLRQKQLETGREGVRLEITIPRSDILVSHFLAWHSVLNGWYLSLDEAEDDRFYDDDTFLNYWRDRHQNPQKAQEIEKSWERIFDIPLLSEHRSWHGEPITQATFGKIALDRIQKATPFISR